MNQLVPLNYNDQRILLTSQLAERYGVTDKVINDNYSNNKARYVVGKDFYCLKGEELRSFKDYPENFGVVDKHAPSVYLWTEHGALLHAKSLGTDEAWEVYGQLVDTYFHVRHKPEESADQIKKSLADAKLFNARARLSGMWLKLADRVDIPEYKQVCAHYASEVLSGRAVIPLPQAGEQFLSAKEVGDLYGVSAKRIGMIANHEGMKTEEFGKWFFDKSPYSSKEIESFKYNEQAVKRFKELVKPG